MCLFYFITELTFAGIPLPESELFGYFHIMSKKPVILRFYYNCNVLLTEFHEFLKCVKNRQTKEDCVYKKTHLFLRYISVAPAAPKFHFFTGFLSFFFF